MSEFSDTSSETRRASWPSPGASEARQFPFTDNSVTFAQLQTASGTALSSESPSVASCPAGASAEALALDRSNAPPFFAARATISSTDAGAAG